ncbi:hypothetical protein [Roseovarius sp. M141]|uniref:hypothetical protein n=1 Tax=Roseovarius sp. M141 TaxID=2583806 RepID=UPI0020CCED99|nr:hypothetical protein [Roseovarius sp. M141]MCQ0094194.1 hypothetical protein [Roseovarius sp. M141]
MPGQIANLSLRALTLATALPPSDVPKIARWLYRYGTAPRGVMQEMAFGSGDHPMAVLELSQGGRARGMLEHHYEVATYPGWLGFSRVTAPLGTGATCKLYISPKPEALAAVFPVLAEVFDAMQVRAFKVGRGLDGLLRPDKIVAHFDDVDHLHTVAAILRKRLGRSPAQGVPFTTALGPDGMLSWGIDPPVGSVAVSWRSWVTHRLAEALVVPLGFGQSRIESVWGRMAEIGVDPTTWTVGPDTFLATQ